MSSSRLAAACAALSITLAWAALGPAAGASSERVPDEGHHSRAAVKTDPQDMEDACETRGPNADETRVSCELR